VWNTVLPAVIAAFAALSGVTIGALVEPLKLAAARRAHIHQERLERCAELVDLANRLRGMAVGINRSFRGEHPSARSPKAETWDQISQPYYEARARLRAVAGVLIIYGPADLADKAEAVRAADGAVAHVRFAAGQPPTDGRPISIPVELKQALDWLDQKTLEFATSAARYV
jgi:hypothetical protein